MSIEEQIQALIFEAVAFGGRLDCILNYAGIARESTYSAPARCHDFDTSDFDKELLVNTRGVWLCCKYALQQMLSQEPLPPNSRNERTRGWIVNCASMLGLTALANTPAYVPSKFAVVGMTKQMAIDYAKDRIHVSPHSSLSPLTLTTTFHVQLQSLTLLLDQRPLSRLRRHTHHSHRHEQRRSQVNGRDETSLEFSGEAGRCC